MCVCTSGEPRFFGGGGGTRRPRSGPRRRFGMEGLVSGGFHGTLFTGKYLAALYRLSVSDGAEKSDIGFQRYSSAQQ